MSLSAFHTGGLCDEKNLTGTVAESYPSGERRSLNAARGQAALGNSRSRFHSQGSNS